MALTPAQEALVVKLGKYYLKHKLMIKAYKDAKDRAIANFRAVGFTADRSKVYEIMWSVMPKHYEDKISAVDARLKKWIRSYADKMFGVTLTDAEVDSIYSKVISGITPLSA